MKEFTFSGVGIDGRVKWEIDEPISLFMNYLALDPVYYWRDVEKETPEDREYVLIDHPDFATPIKAWYRDDCPGASWIFPRRDKYGKWREHSEYIWESEVKYWCRLPELPQIYRKPEF